MKHIIKNVVGYVRISSDSQKDNTSIAEQKKRIQAYCTSQEWKLKEIFVDEAKSGSKIDERIEYSKMLDFARDKENVIDAIIVIKSDRIHRHLKNLLIMIEDDLQPHGIAFISVSENFDTSLPQGMLTLQMLGSFAEFERNLINERTRSGRIVTARSGKYAGGKIPYGYILADGKFEINEHEAKIVREMFQIYAEGKSYGYIAKYISSLQKQSGSDSGSCDANKTWSRTSICYILRNSSYTGLLSYDGKKEKNQIQVKASIPAIVSKQLFNKVQALREQKRKTST
ncbi:site-specific DNA recombinase [Paenibacillus sp. V4I9]|uniref:recombinase family protein n=1 Tax=Paenibacillus sp. V4I9 TaxID=3042308 RepID=UPI002784F76C|nr:recombinase family protein [Paenibacillus sp. V4I9]MDQ0890684.1 site-specific DNA recombinase [Paenibacillus sp. V4I9]